MAGDMTIGTTALAGSAGSVGEGRRRGALAPDTAAGGPLAGGRITVSESVTLSAQALALTQDGASSRTTSVTLSQTRQVDLYAPQRPRQAVPKEAAAAESTSVPERLGAEEVAKNVLGFVAERLEREKASGASEERLRGLLEDAREGIEQGYAEAREELDARGLLDADLEARIGDGRERIDAGLDRLAARLASAAPLRDDTPDTPRPAPRDSGREDAKASAGEESRVRRAADEARPERSRPSAPSGGSAVGAGGGVAAGESVALERSSYAEASMGIEVVTRDGDRVTLYGYQSDASLATSASQREGGSLMATASTGLFQAGGYRLVVEGELDEDEMQALEDLVGQVQGVARQFFAGDFARAFDSALQLQSDPGEIAAFAVSLASRQVEQVSSRYGAGSSNPGTSLYEPLARQASGVRGALENAAPFAERAALVQRMIEAFARQQDDTTQALDQYLEFTRQIAARIEQTLFPS